MRTVKGIYENGTIKLLEQPPALEGSSVLITFLEEDDNEETIIRNLVLQNTTHDVQHYLKDEREDLYQEYIK